MLRFSYFAMLSRWLEASHCSRMCRMRIDHRPKTLPDNYSSNKLPWHINQRKEKENTTPFGMSVMRSQVLYGAAQVLIHFIHS